MNSARDGQYRTSSELHHGWPLWDPVGGRRGPFNKRMDTAHFVKRSYASRRILERAKRR